MDRFEETKSAVRIEDYAAAKLERANGGYVCPNCASGTGPNGTPALSIKGDRFRCFSFGCGASGDVFDLAALVEGIDPKDRAGQLRAVREWAGIPETDTQAPRPTGKSAYKAPQAASKASEARKGTDAAERDKAAETGRFRVLETEYVERCKESVEQARGYIEGRGFSMEQASAWGWGYDPSAGGAKDASGAWCKRGRVVIPFPGSSFYHIDRATDPEAKQHKYDKPKAYKVGKQPLWWPEGADGAKALWLVEGPLDALAIEAEGGVAVAACGAAPEDSIRAIKRRGFGGAVIVAFDPDEKGRLASAKAEELLAKLSMPRRIAAWPEEGPAKMDACEWRRRDPEAFRAFLRAEEEAAAAALDAAEQAEYDAALLRLRAKDPSTVVASLLAGETRREPTPTGFGPFDEILGGGLVDGQLYAFGGGSSVGKTTFMLQIADHIAASGRPVLFVSIEQSAAELVAKSLSRMASRRGARVTASDVPRPERWSVEQADALTAALEEYGDAVCERLLILEADGAPTVADVAAAARWMAERRGRMPVVFIDYLQLIAADDETWNNKGAVDRNVMELRQMARSLKAPVMVVSSLNRAAYYMPVDMPSFKESGSIEYSADVLFGIQPRDLEKRLEGLREFESKQEGKAVFRKCKAAAERKLEITVIKNRNGRTTDEPIPCTLHAPSGFYSFEGPAPRRSSKPRRAV